MGTFHFLIFALFLSFGCSAPKSKIQFQDNVVTNIFDEPAEIGTWSIIAVDYETGQIGIAGASCTFNVQGISEIIPGKGAVIVQGMSSDEARERAMEYNTY